MACFYSAIMAWNPTAVDIEGNVTQLIDRAMDAESPTLIKAYENRIQGLEARKAELRERIAQTGRTPNDFERSFRTAMTFLANPHKIWVSGDFRHKRLVLKLAFADRLQYLRGNGFRTALTSSPFTLLSDLSGGREEMVRAGGLEPPRAKPDEFSYQLRLSPPPEGRLWSGLSLHLAPASRRVGAARLVSTPSRKPNFRAWLGIAMERFPRV